MAEIRYQVLIINFKTNDLRLKRGIKKQDDEKVWVLKVFGDNVDELPFPNEEYLHGHHESSKKFGKPPNKYVVLGTHDDQNYFFVKKGESEELKIIPEDYRKWSFMHIRRMVEKFQSIPNWQKLLMYGGPILVGVLVFAGFMLFITQGIPALENVAGNFVCNCVYNVSEALPFNPL